MTKNEKYMMRCLALASKGSGNVSPNPLVGCVIVKNDKIIAEGYHKKYGSFHAERNAINNAIKKGINLKGSTLYVNLEPCAHFGKTPPCVDLIIENKIKRVVVGVKDPYYLVAGKSIRKLNQRGIKVLVGVLEDESRELNKFFFKYVATGLPYIMLKAAQTIDGKITDRNYKSKWISSEESRKFVHKLRTTYDAVLVGKNTVERDNPELTVRKAEGRNPFRIIIDKNLKLSLNKKVFSDRHTNKTIVLTTKSADKKIVDALNKKSVKVVFCKVKNGVVDLKDALKRIAKLGINSIIAEGGAKTYSEFLRLNLVDEFMIFIAPKIMGEGINAFNQKMSLEKYKRITYFKTDRDILINIKK